MPNRAETIANTTGDVDPDRGASHRRIAAADRVESAAPRCLFSHHRSPWSKPNDPQGAVDGIKNGGFGFQTNIEPKPWWQVDLGAVQPLDWVVLFNRQDCCAERSRTVHVLLSDDGRTFRDVFAHDGSIFGGARDGRPLQVPLHGARGRYVRLQLTAIDYFHLDEVEVYGAPLGAPAAAASGTGSMSGCDLHHVDWMNHTYPGSGQFKGGQGSDGAGPNGPDCSVGTVSYGDLDGNGSLEAYVPIDCNPAGNQASDNVTFAVFEMGPQCTPRSLGTLDGGPTATGKVVGRSFVVEGAYAKDGDPECCWSGVRRQTYRLANGKFSASTQTVK